MTGYKKHWTLDDIPWDNFDPLEVDPEMLRIVKGAALVEHNGSIYAEYLSNVFYDDVSPSRISYRAGTRH